METAVDRFGRVLIPKSIRDHLGLKPGVLLHIEEQGEDVLLKPVENEPSVVLKKGIAVFTGKATGDIEKAVKNHREQRIISKWE